MKENVVDGGHASCGGHRQTSAARVLTPGLCPSTVCNVPARLRQSNMQPCARRLPPAHATACPACRQPAPHRQQRQERQRKEAPGVGHLAKQQVDCGPDVVAARQQQAQQAQRAAAVVQEHVGAACSGWQPQPHGGRELETSGSKAEAAAACRLGSASKARPGTPRRPSPTHPAPPQLEHSHAGPGGSGCGPAPAPPHLPFTAILREMNVQCRLASVTASSLWRMYTRRRAGWLHAATRVSATSTWDMPTAAMSAAGASKRQVGGFRGAVAGRCALGLTPSWIPQSNFASFLPLGQRPAHPAPIGEQAGERSVAAAQAAGCGEPYLAAPLPSTA